MNQRNRSLAGGFAGAVVASSVELLLMGIRLEANAVRRCGFCGLGMFKETR